MSALVTIGNVNVYGNVYGNVSVYVEWIYGFSG